MILVTLLFTLLLALLLVGPLWYQSRQVSPIQSDENLRLYQERCADLAQSDMEEEQKQALQLELDREFLANQTEEKPQLASSSRKRWPVLVLLLLFCLSGAFGLYQIWGASNELRATELLEKTTVRELSKDEQQELAARLERAAKRNNKNPEWGFLSGRMSLEQGQYERAASVFADVLVALPMDDVTDRSAVMNMLAQARFFGANQKVTPETYELLKGSLELNPNQPQTQGLAGMMAFELGHYQAAIGHWKALWQNLGDSPEADLLAQGIKRAAEHLNAQGETVDLRFLTERVALKVHVDVSPEVRQAFAPDTVVFVAARAVDGPPMPLAVQKLTLAQLPIDITLTDAQAMVPGMSLSNFAQVSVRAHLSTTGAPTVKAGDYAAEQTPVDPKQKASITLLIHSKL